MDEQDGVEVVGEVGSPEEVVVETESAPEVDREPGWEPAVDVPVELPASPAEAPYQPRVHGAPRAASVDERGVVVVRVSLRGVSRNGKPAQHQSGNIIKSFSISEAKVSEVYEYLHRACFGADPA